MAEEEHTPPAPRSMFERFWTKVREDPTSGCWVWVGYRVPLGYGCFNSGGRRGPMIYAHRYTYRQLAGPIPSWLEIDHLCRNPACVNPAHLELVTHQENILRGNNPAAQNAQKTHCPSSGPETEKRPRWRCGLRAGRDGRHDNCPGSPLGSPPVGMPLQVV